MTILQVIFPIFAMALVGYVAVYKGILDTRDTEGISRFVFNIAIPALLFNSLAHVELPARFNWKFLLSYYVVTLIIYGLGVMVSRYWFVHSFQEQGVFGLGASYSNTVLVGLPVISVGLGDVALLPLFMIVSIHSAVLLSVFMVWIERGNGRGLSRRQIVYQTVKKLVRNPVIVSLVLGLVFNLFAIPIPSLVDNTLGILSKAIDQAEQECLADSEARARRREREAARQVELDRQYVEDFAGRIRELFPECPPGREVVIAEHACLKYSGRVGRSAAAKSLDENAIRLAVIAHIRHVETDYDTLLASGYDRHEARSAVETAVSRVLRKWMGPAQR